MRQVFSSLRLENVEAVAADAARRRHRGAHHQWSFLQGQDAQPLELCRPVGTEAGGVGRAFAGPQPRPRHPARTRPARIHATGRQLPAAQLPRRRRTRRRQDAGAAPHVPLQAGPARRHRPDHRAGDAARVLHPQAGCRARGAGGIRPRRARRRHAPIARARGVREGSRQAEAGAVPGHRRCRRLGRGDRGDEAAVERSRAGLAMRARVRPRTAAATRRRPASRRCW